MELPAEREQDDADSDGVPPRGSGNVDVDAWVYEDPAGFDRSRSLRRRFFGRPRVEWAAASAVLYILWIAIGVVRLVVDPSSPWSWVWCFLGLLQLSLIGPALWVALQDRKHHRGFYQQV